jgi:hypothetical protein
MPALRMDAHPGYWDGRHIRPARSGDLFRCVSATETGREALPRGEPATTALHQPFPKRRSPVVVRSACKG